MSRSALGVLAVFILPITFVGFPAYAQYGGNSVPTPDLLGRCNELGIPLDKCTEQNILAEQGVQKQVARTEEAQPSFDFVLITGIVGAVIGTSAISIYLITLRTKKENKQANQR